MREKWLAWALIATLVLVGCGGGGGGGGADEVSGDPAEFCRVGFTVGTNITDPGNPDLSQQHAALLAASYESLVPLAPTAEVRDAVETLARFYRATADGETLSPVLLVKVQPAQNTFGLYLARCATDLVITEFTLPDGSPVTLPGGGPVTLPPGLPDLPDLSNLPGG